MTPLLDQRPTLSLSSTSAVYGTIVTLRGHVDANTEGTITIERSISGGSWSVLGVAAADAAGDTSIRTTARANARYRLHVARSSTRIERTSSTVALTVRRKVALRSTRADEARSVIAGTHVSLTAVATPSTPATTITFSVYRFSAARNAYALSSSTKRTTVRGIAALTWRPTARGRYYIRLSVPGTSTLASGISATYRWNVT